jgi:DNA-binding NtrC family response regulator
MSQPFDFALVVDDDPDIALAARLALRELFVRVETLTSPDELATVLKKDSPDVILLDLNFERGATDGREGLEQLGRIMKLDPDAAVVIITAHGAVSVAVEAIKRGASDFVAKPWGNERLAATVRSAAALRRTRIEARLERERSTEIGQPSAETPLLGKSDAMSRVRQLIERAAPTDANVLILGENGTGKEIVAREIHRLSRRASKPMVAIDLGATSESLFESELFGHMKGAFTGASSDRLGRLKAADHSTLFLDEIGNLPLHLQPKLLTALEQRQVVPVGANKAVPIDVRVVAATNLSAEKLSDESRFRQDLLFRLNTIEIHLPPLRERRDDIRPLAEHLLRRYAARYRKALAGFEPEALEALEGHAWPGNVRELDHTLERAVLMAQGPLVRGVDLGLRGGGPATRLEDLPLEEVERVLIRKALERHGGNVSQAAKALGLSRSALYRRLQHHGL